jgi:hypothetical protein
VHPDDQVLASLEQAGSDLSVPHTLEYYLYFPSSLAASQARSELELSGFAILRFEPGAKLNSVLVLAARSLVPDRLQVIALSDQLEALARKFGGECDGWETAIVRRAI